MTVSTYIAAASWYVHDRNYRWGTTAAEGTADIYRRDNDWADKVGMKRVRIDAWIETYERLKCRGMTSSTPTVYPSHTFSNYRTDPAVQSAPLVDGSPSVFPRTPIKKKPWCKSINGVIRPSPLLLLQGLASVDNDTAKHATHSLRKPGKLVTITAIKENNFVRSEEPQLRAQRG